MIFQLFLLIFLLFIIFLTSKRFINQIYLLFLKVFKNKKAAVWGMAILFLPGTVVHELSHLMMALVLRVPTGPMSIWPKIIGDSPAVGGTVPFRVKVGHIMVAKTSPFKLTLIGVAPMIVGLTIIYFVGFYTRGENFLFTPRVIIMIYILFVTSTSMFSSKQDLKSLLITLPVAILIMAAIYLSGVKIMIEGNLIDVLRKILVDLNRSLILTVGIDCAVLVILVAIKKI